MDPWRPSRGVLTMEPWLQIALQILAPSGVVMWSVKVALNGTHQRVKEIHEDVKETRDDIKELREVYHNLSGRIFLLESEDAKS